MRLSFFIPLAVTVALTGCSTPATPERPAGLLASNDFEGLDGWATEASKYISKAKAHSGAYAAQIGPGQEYAANFINPLGKLTSERVTKFKVQAWVFLPSANATGQLVTEISEPGTGKQLLWEALDLGKDVRKYQEWVKVEKTITLPAEANMASVLKVYLWHSGGGSDPLYLDDLQILKTE